MKQTAETPIIECPSVQVLCCVYSTQENSKAIKDQIYLSQSLMRV